MAFMAAVAPVPWWPPPPELAPMGFLDAPSPAGYPEPQTLPFLLAPPPPPPLPAGYYSTLPPWPRSPSSSLPDPSFVAEVDQRRSSSLVQFLKDEGVVPSPEDEKKREKVIRELKKHWADAVAYEQSVPQGLATATVLTYGSYTLRVSKTTRIWYNPRHVPTIIGRFGYCLRAEIRTGPRRH